MQKKENLISVIVNCYNGEKFLKNCINSILNQTYKNFEIIFLDNNSSDQSVKIIKEFASPKIKLFQNQNYLKLYEARNLAIKKSEGNFITFLDTDDWWDKDKLQKQLDEFLLNREISFTYSNFFNFFQKKENMKLAHNSVLPSGDITQDSLNKYKIGILTTMIRREVFDSFKFNSKYEIIGDFDFFIKISQKYLAKGINQPLAYYRIHDKNLSKEKSKLYIKELEQWLLENKKEFNIKGYSLKKQKILLLKLKIKEFLKKFNLYF